jgi:hypothetical protein
LDDGEARTVTTLLLTALLVFTPKYKPAPLDYGHTVWVLGVDDFGRETKRDYGPITSFWSGKVTVEGRMAEWDCELYGVRRIADGYRPGEK